MTIGRLVARSLLAVIPGGLIVGGLVKLADESAFANQLGLNDLGTYLGFWVVLVAALATLSPSLWLAALRVSAFMLAMVAAYYGVSQLLFGFVPLLLWLAWTVVALTAAPLLAVIVWQARGRQASWLGALGAALPVGLLLWEAYSLRLVLPLHATQFAFDLVAATALFVLLPRNRTQRLRTALLAPLVIIAAGVGFNRILPLMLGFLQG